MTYLDVAGDGRWNVTLTGASIGGKAVDALSNVPVIMDTGEFPRGISHQKTSHAKSLSQAPA